MNTRPRDHPLGGYFLLAYVLSWGSIAVGRRTRRATRPRPACRRTPASGPHRDACRARGGGLALTWLTSERAGLSDVGARARRWRVGPRWYAVAALSTPAV